MATEKAKIILEADDKSTAKIGRVQKSLGGLGEKTSQIGKKLKAAFVPVTVALGAIALGMQKAVSSASDLEETTAKFATVFSNNIGVANASVRELTKSYAMSTEEARRNLAAVQDLLVPMGMNSEAAAKMSSEVVKLSADLGSFNNLPTSQVMGDIQSALVGNFETMKKYGVVLNETRIKQEAMNLGLWDGKGMLDASTKAQVAYNLIVQGSQAAVGDMARTSDSYANVMKRLKATVSDVTAEIGIQLIPAAKQIALVFIDVVKKIGTAIKSVIYLFKNWDEATKIFTDIWKTAMENLKENFIAFLEIFQAGGEAIVMLLTGKFKEAIDTVKDAFINNNQTIADNFGELRDKLTSHYAIVAKKAEAASKLEVKQIQQKNKLLAKEDDKDKKAQIAREKFLADAKKNIYKNIGSAFADLASLFGEKYRALFEISKAAAYAETIVQTYKGVTAAIASMAGAGPVGWIAGAIQAGAQLAGGLANAAKISAQQMEFGGIIPGSTFGTPIVAGEKGKSEGILPLEGEGLERMQKAIGSVGGGATYNIYIENMYADDDTIPEKVAESIDEALERRRDSGMSSFGNGLTNQLAMGI